MSLIELDIAPGIITERTERGAKARWRNGNRVRFRKGLPEKVGGWQSSSLTGDALEGAPRGLHRWQMLSGERVLAIGTSQHLYQAYGGTLTNITPYRLSTAAFAGSDPTLTDPFTTTSGSSSVNVTHTGHGLTEGTTVSFANATAVGGLTIDGTYTVAALVDTDNYTIEDDETASASAAGGGTVDYAYEINVGGASALLGRGWGTGGWGVGTWGTPRSSGTVILVPRTWAFANWGEDLIANPRNAGIYVWDASSGFSSTNRATLISPNAPAQAAFTIVSAIDRHLIAFGCTPIGGGARDPLVIRWCSQDDFTDWTPTRVNDSGQRRLSGGGSEILSAMRVREEIAIFTDTSLFAMTAVSPPVTFNIREIGGGCGIAGPLARAEFRGIAFWMSYEDFFFYDGSLDVLPCDVRNHVFDDLNRSQAAKFHAGVNSTFQEIWFFYCSANSNEIDRYVVFNPQEQHWTIGELERTAWIDQSAGTVVPAAIDASGTLYDHETGTTDDGDSMQEYLKSWDMEIDPNGNSVFLVRRFVPDWLFSDGAMLLKLRGKKWPEGEEVERGPMQIPQERTFISPRLRARQISMEFSSDQAFPETHWRAGAWRVDARPHGRR